MYTANLVTSRGARRVTEQPRKVRTMKGPCKVLNIAILVVCIFGFAYSVMAANLELDDFSGQTGPASPPAPFATTTLWMNNSPNDVAWFKIRINYNPDVLGGYSVSLNNALLGSWDYKNVWHVSGSSDCYYNVECWTVGAPITTGSSGPLAEITFEVKQNINSQVTLSNLEHDIEGWTTKDAAFTFVPSVGQPVANAGPDQLVFGEVTLDGSASSDTDGTITPWEWTLTHRTNSSFNRTASGKKPTVSNLAAGFYDVVLTITDNCGKIGTDTMLLGAAGPWDINDDEKLGLAEIIHILQTLSGVRTHSN